MKNEMKRFATAVTLTTAISFVAVFITAGILNLIEGNGFLCFSTIFDACWYSAWYLCWLFTKTRNNEKRAMNILIIALIVLLALLIGLDLLVESAGGGDSASALNWFDFIDFGVNLLYCIGTITIANKQAVRYKKMKQKYENA